MLVFCWSDINTLLWFKVQQEVTLCTKSRKINLSNSNLTDLKSNVFQLVFQLVISFCSPSTRGPPAPRRQMWGSPGESWDLTTEHQREVVKDFKASMMDGSLITLRTLTFVFKHTSEHLHLQSMYCLIWWLFIYHLQKRFDWHVNSPCNYQSWLESINQSNNQPQYKSSLWWFWVDKQTGIKWKDQILYYWFFYLF